MGMERYNRILELPQNYRRKSIWNLFKINLA